MSILKVENLTKVFSKGQESALAVDQLCFELNRGEILGILGPNGAGKTTTIEMLLGTLTPTSGTISYFGQNFAKKQNVLLKSIGHASAYHKLPGSLTLERNLEIIARLWNMPRLERKQRIEKLLHQFKLFEYRKAVTSSLSAGQMTRLLLIKAFLPHPKILLLDEPTASLDPDIAKDVRHYILELQAEYGVSIILTSHNMEEVAHMCSRALVLQQGKVIEEDTPEQLAKSVAITQLILVVDDLSKAVSVLDSIGSHFTITDHTIKIEIDECHIPSLLKQITLKGVDYTHLEIQKPTLEDYFLHISRQT